MSELDCTQCRELGAELALGVVDGWERARMVAHLDGCLHCREHVRELTVLGDQVAALVPGGEPPIGFEQRVLERYPVATAPRHRWRVPAAAAAAVVLLGAGWAIGTLSQPGGSPAPPAATATAAETGVLAAALTSNGHRIGWAYAHPGQHPWLTMAFELDRPITTTVSCRLVRADGSTMPVGSFRVTGGYGYWAGPAAIDPDTLAGARLLDTHGRVLASGNFGQ